MCLSRWFLLETPLPWRVTVWTEICNSELLSLNWLGLIKIWKYQPKSILCIDDIIIPFEEWILFLTKKLNCIFCQRLKFSCPCHDVPYFIKKPVLMILTLPWVYKKIIHLWVITLKYTDRFTSSPFQTDGFSLWKRSDLKKLYQSNPLECFVTFEIHLFCLFVFLCCWQCLVLSGPNCLVKCSVYPNVFRE